MKYVRTILGTIAMLCLPFAVQAATVTAATDDVNLATPEVMISANVAVQTQPSANVDNPPIVSIPIETGHTATLIDLSAAVGKGLGQSLAVGDGIVVPFVVEHPFEMGIAYHTVAEHGVIAQYEWSGSGAIATVTAVEYVVPLDRTSLLMSASIDKIVALTSSQRVGGKIAVTDVLIC